jgi:hypothetical protein
LGLNSTSTTVKHAHVMRVVPHCAVGGAAVTSGANGCVVRLRWMHFPPGPHGAIREKLYIEPKNISCRKRMAGRHQRIQDLPKKED